MSQRSARPLPGRRLAWLAAAAGLLLAAPARAEELVRLLSPPAGATLEAGSTLTLEWVPGPGLAAFVGAEEWEVFLSLDGGRTYLARITPHLDLAVRRVRVRLPDLPSADARLLLRMGDERIEREQELPGRWRIVPAAPYRAAGELRAEAFEPVWRSAALHRGESARRGQPGVVSWVEGGRDGSGWSERRSAPPSRGLAPALSPEGLGLLAAAAGPRELGPPERAVRIGAVTPLRHLVPSAATLALPRAAPFALLRRRNE